MSGRVFSAELILQKKNRKGALMSPDNDPLCCCEYFDIQQERNHILACCCNCQDLDESFESFITGKGVPPTRAQRFMATLQDRMRIPWQGGARKVAPDAILPIFILPTMLLLAAINFWWTVVIFSLMLAMLSYLYYCCMRTLQRTKFFLVWTVTSLAILFLVFEFIVMPFLEILVHENVAVILLVIACVACVYVVKMRSNHLRYLIENEIEIGECGKVGVGRTHYCSICQISVPERDHHCIWFDCCIGFHNRFLFLVAVGLALGALLYSSNLSLTSVCHPFHIYKTILLPDDCSDVYEQFELSLSFVSALYSLAIASVLGIFLLYEILLISIGLTGQEWRALPISTKLCCAINAHRPYDKGFFSNWFRATCYCQRYQKVACQY